MNRRMIALLALVIFCLVGAVASAEAANHYNIMLCLGLTLMFLAGFFICIECFRKTSWEQQNKKDKKNG